MITRLQVESGNRGRLPDSTEPRQPCSGMPPTLGEHSDEILAELGLDAETLKSEGVVA